MTKQTETYWIIDTDGTPIVGVELKKPKDINIKFDNNILLTQLDGSDPNYNYFKMARLLADQLLGPLNKRQWYEI